MSFLFVRFFIAILFSFLFLAAPFSAQAEIKILALGDSLTSGYGLKASESYPAQLQAALAANGKEVTLLNGGISGDTTAGGKSRLDWVLSQNPQIVIVALGGNDMLRGISPDVTRGNLDSILHTLTQKNITVVFAGMKAPLNMGPAYASRFNGLFEDLAQKYGVIFYPFFLEGVAQNPALNLADGIHPNKHGIAIMVRNTLPYVEQALKAVD